MKKDDYVSIVNLGPRVGDLIQLKSWAFGEEGRDCYIVVSIEHVSDEGCSWGVLIPGNSKVSYIRWGYARMVSELERAVDG